MTLYRGLLRRVLSSRRCVAIRCLSEACRATLRLLFGDEVHARAEVHYPRLARKAGSVPPPSGPGCRFLFVSTQFEIKGGVALLRAFRRVHQRYPDARLDLVTHLPPEHAELASTCPGVRVHEASFSRGEIAERFLRNADVLVHPTYVESFGMVVLEALSFGLAVVATDVYAMREMVEDGVNGACIRPPVSIWDGVLPSAAYYDLPRIKDRIRALGTAGFERELERRMGELAADPQRTYAARRASLDRFVRVFSRPESGE
jgi:glycosyltransferase involved in cell wall biosynthesis